MPAPERRLARRGAPLPGPPKTRRQSEAPDPNHAMNGLGISNVIAWRAGGTIILDQRLSEIEVTIELDPRRYMQAEARPQLYLAPDWSRTAGNVAPAEGPRVRLRLWPMARDCDNR
jgi:hypothetical protein